jgi:hypothetical protein
MACQGSFLLQNAVLNAFQAALKFRSWTIWRKRGLVLKQEHDGATPDEKLIAPAKQVEYSWSSIAINGNMLIFPLLVSTCQDCRPSFVPGLPVPLSLRIPALVARLS